ncbi:MAG: FAD-linked oxidase C-terminal domain-containing protein [Pseudomonadota bacterium]
MVPVDKLIDRFGALNVITDRLELLCFARDMSVHRGVLEAIVTPTDTAMVASLLEMASDHGFAVTARGAGSSVTGAVLPIRPSVICDLGRMNRIKKISHEDRFAVVEPGVVCSDLNAALAPRSFFAPDPGSATVATIAGMVATNASGLRAVKYGTTRHHVMALEVVLPDGKIIRTGTIAPKETFGYDLTSLFAASEGTLGIITEVTVKLTPTPRYTAIATAYFDELENAGRSVSKILADGIPLSICEIMDRSSIEITNNVMNMGLKQAEALIIMEVDGHPAAVKDDIEKIVAICNENGSTSSRWTDDPDERNRLWMGRRGLVPSLSRVKPGCRLIPVAEDFGVPTSKIPDTIKAAQDIARRHDAMVATFGHVGDGNVHTTFIGDVRKEEDWKKLRAVAGELVKLVADMKGTMSAEHGIGIAKAPFARLGLGDSIDCMKKIKQAIDPKNILNPGKMGFDDSVKDIYDHFAFSEILKRKQGEYPLGEEAENELLLCVQCGFCRNVCPTYQATGLESMNARGRNILAYDLSDGTLDLSLEVAGKFFTCTTCMNCKYACPSRIDVAGIVHSVRERLQEKGKVPEPIKAVTRSIREYKNPLGQPADKRLEVFPRDIRKKKQEGGYAGGEVLLWLGCMASYADMKIVSSTLKIMEAAGDDYFFFGEDEGCCGYFVHLVGDRAFADIAAKNIERIKATGAKKLVTPCAGCFRTFKSLYSGMADMGIETLHIAQYVEQAVEAGKLELKNNFDKKVIYHDPCDLGRHMSVYDAPRGLISRIARDGPAEFKRNRELAQCCGGGGGLVAADNDLSMSISDKRAGEAAEQSADVIVSACASCKGNLKKSAAKIRKQQKKTIKVMDITELIASAL